MALLFFKTLINKAKSFLSKKLPSAVNKLFEAAGKIINTVIPIANKTIEFILAALLGVSNGLTRG
jgi:hypothetical protein